jgi:hypothetical protein
VQHKLTFHQVPVGLDGQGRDAVDLVPPSASEAALKSLALATRCPRTRTAALEAESVATASATAPKASATSASTGAAAALLTPRTFGSYITKHKHNNKHMRNTGSICVHFLMALTIRLLGDGLGGVDQLEGAVLLSIMLVDEVGVGHVVATAESLRALVLRERRNAEVGNTVGALLFVEVGIGHVLKGDDLAAAYGTPSLGVETHLELLDGGSTGARTRGTEEIHGSVQMLK